MTVKPYEAVLDAVRALGSAGKKLWVDPAQVRRATPRPPQQRERDTSEAPSTASSRPLFVSGAPLRMKLWAFKRFQTAPTGSAHLCQPDRGCLECIHQPRGT